MTKSWSAEEGSALGPSPHKPRCRAKNRNRPFQEAVAILFGGENETFWNNKQLANQTWALEGRGRSETDRKWETGNCSSVPFGFGERSVRATAGLAKALLRIQSRVKESICRTAARLSWCDAYLRSAVFVLAEAPRLSTGLIIVHVAADQGEDLVICRLNVQHPITGPGRIMWNR